MKRYLSIGFKCQGVNCIRAYKCERFVNDEKVEKTLCQYVNTDYYDYFIESQEHVKKKVMLMLENFKEKIHETEKLKSLLGDRINTVKEGIERLKNTKYSSVEMSKRARETIDRQLILMLEYENQQASFTRQIQALKRQKKSALNKIQNNRENKNKDSFRNLKFGA